MRRSRRGGGHGLEFGGSGEDSFVAVVVTKLTGALLFILLLTMVIMALLPKAIDLPSTDHAKKDLSTEALSIATPDALPEAIAGRPYQIALASKGGRGQARWAVEGAMPAGLHLDESGLIQGVPTSGMSEPVTLTLRVLDDSGRASKASKLMVYQPDRPLTAAAKWKPSLPPLPWREWVEQGFGFLVLTLIHLVGLASINAMSRRAGRSDEPESQRARRRFATYRIGLWTLTAIAMAGLAVWLVFPVAR